MDIKSTRELDPEKPCATAHLDWLTLVFTPTQARLSRMPYWSDEIELQVIFELLHLNRLKDVISYGEKHELKGIYAYTKGLSLANNSIIFGWYDGLPQGPGYEIDADELKSRLSFMVQLSGAGVETLESCLALDDLTVENLFQKLLSDELSVFWDIAVTRIDACVNLFNYSKEYSARYVAEEAEAGNLITSARRVKTVHSFSSAGSKTDETAYQGETEGYTLYIGKNPCQCRIYNKKAERNDKVNLQYDFKSWSRWEWQLNGDQAEFFVGAWCNSGWNLPKTWANWTKSHFRVIERVGHQAKRSRYPTASWFEELVSTANTKIMMRRERMRPTFKQAQHWINKQVMPTFSTIVQARIKKYVENGITYSDAVNLAFEKVKNDVFETIEDDRIDKSQVDAFVAEQLELEKTLGHRG